MNPISRFASARKAPLFRSPRSSTWLRSLLVATSLVIVSAQSSFGDPIALHPDNPHYFLWKGRATALITSGEHYGSVLNLDFDFRRYLTTLSADGMMLTRTFSGTYAEPQGAFNIANNSLAPRANRFICPWSRSTEPGYTGGGNKFDLSQWDPAYFQRLREFIDLAQSRDIIVEFTFFCPMYEDKQWRLSPMNASNNVNRVGAIGRDDVHTLDRNGGLLAIQEALVRKLVTELNSFDNVMFEICNEPYFGGVTIPWQHHIADLVVKTERSLPKRHLITQNIANNQAKIDRPHPAVSVFNFHYATPPNTVAMNYGLNKVIGDNETGFRGTNNLAYRSEGWEFILAGGALYNNLDYSFVPGHEDGTFIYPASQPGGGNPQFRREMRILRDFINGFDLPAMRPHQDLLKGGLPPGASVRILAEPARAMAAYLRAEGATGPWSARWTGSLEVPAGGDYALHTVSNDGVRLWVDGKLVIDNWTDHSETEDTAQSHLTSGRHTLKLEYFYNGGQGVTKLLWTPPGGRKVAVPANAFHLPGQAGWGLRGEYFYGTDLKTPWSTRDDGTIQFAWGVKPPLIAGAPDASIGRTTTLQIDLAAGRWQAEWLDTQTGSIVGRESIIGGKVVELPAPSFTHDIALRLRRENADRP